MKYVWRLFAREIRDTTRDRRTLISMIIVPLALMPLMILLPGSIMVKETEKAQEEEQKIAILGESAPDGLLDEIRKAANLEIISPSDPEKALKENNVQAVLRLPSGLQEKIATEETVELEILYDATKPDSKIAVRKLRENLRRYGDRITAKRLEKFNLKDSILKPLNVVSKNIATKEQMGRFALGLFLPMMIAIWAAMGGMYTAIDTTAGEKERGTLEPLLVTPSPRHQIVFSKFLAIITISIVSILLMLTSMLLTIRFGIRGFPGLEGLIKINISPTSIALIILGALLLSGTVSGIMLVLCIFARSYKEAQTYVTPLTFIIFFPAIFLQVMRPFEPTISHELVPIFNCMILFKNALEGSLGFPQALVILTSSLIYALLALALATKIFNRESVIFRT